jgi:pyruvate formate lyase activating enzyme
MVTVAKRTGSKLIGSSYNEPLITSEWAIEIFKIAKEHGIRGVYVSNGNATREVLEYIRPHVVGYKVDLKSMQDKNYRKLGAPLQHILDAIKMVKAMGFWLEIVTLIIPGFNDSNEELMDAAQYIRSVSPDIPWHVTAFHPDYKMTDSDLTPASTLIRAAEIGQEAGLHYVYAGNLPGSVKNYENTYCPKCGTALVERFAYRIRRDHLTGRGECYKCGEKIPGIWS